MQNHKTPSRHHATAPRLARYPAAALLGPRQSGKTTLARSLLRRYYDAEQPANRVRLDLDWEAITAGHELLTGGLRRGGHAQLVREHLFQSA